MFYFWEHAADDTKNNACPVLQDSYDHFDYIPRMRLVDEEGDAAREGGKAGDHDGHDRHHL